MISVYIQWTPGLALNMQFPWTDKTLSVHKPQGKTSKLHKCLQMKGMNSSSRKPHTIKGKPTRTHQCNALNQCMPTYHKPGNIIEFAISMDRQRHFCVRASEWILKTLQMPSNAKKWTLLSRKHAYHQMPQLHPICRIKNICRDGDDDVWWKPRSLDDANWERKPVNQTSSGIWPPLTWSASALMTLLTTSGRLSEE